MPIAILAITTIGGLALAFYGDIVVNIPLMLTGIGIVLAGVIICSILLPPPDSQEADTPETDAPDR